MATAEELKRLANRAAQQQNLASPERSTPGPSVNPERLRRLSQQFQQQRTRATVDTSRPREQTNLPAFQDTKSFGEYLTTLGSLTKSVATGAATSVQASGEAIGVGIYEFIRGDEDPILAAIQAGQEVQDRGFGALGFNISAVPGDETAQDVLAEIGEPLQFLEQKANEAGNFVRDKTGSTALGSATATSIVLLPDLVGLRDTTGRAARRREVRETQASLREQGIDPRSPTQQKVEQISSAARESTGGMPQSGSMDSVLNAVQDARRQLKAAQDQAWDTVRQTEGYVNINEIAPLGRSVREALENRQFDLEDPSFRQVNARLNELDELTMPGGATENVTLAQLVNFRKRLNSNIPSDNSAKAANAIIKAQFDEYLLNDFSVAAISGDPAAQRNWKAAIDASTEFKTLFNSRDGRYRVLRELTRQELTPESARRLIFGANAIQGNTQSALYVSAIKDLIGENSPQFQALKNDAVLDIFEPILVRNPELPDLQRFVERYDRVFRRSPSLANELFGEGASDLRSLVQASRAAIDTQDVGKIFNIDVARTTSRLVLGNSLARNASLIELGTSAIRLIGRIRGKRKKRAFLGQMLGYDPNVPLIPKAQLATIEGLRGASVRTAEEEEEEE